MALPLFLKASHNQDFSDSEDTNLAYLAVELKTNLDKTMFQEASATAYDLKLALPSSRYFLLCEWLDMTPISTALTAIEEVIVLRKAKRMSANVLLRPAEGHRIGTTSSSIWTTILSPRTHSDGSCRTWNGC